MASTDPSMQPTPPPPPSPPPPTYPPYAPPPPRMRRLARSSRERMWAGVAGGIAEYFDLDPAIVRLLWVAATVVTGGAAIAVYILAWIILPRDDRPPVASQVPTETTMPTAEQPGDQPWWQSEQYSPARYHHRPHTKSTGVVLVALGILLLAANAGVFNWIEWRNMWPLIFIGLGIILLGRQWSR